MWRRNERRRSARRASRSRSALWALGLVVVALSFVLSACGQDPHADAAHQNKAKLDAELHHASADLGIPDSLLAPVEKQEKQITAGEGGWTYNYQNAASNYALLYTQLIGIEQTATQTLRTQTQADTDAFTKALNEKRGEGYSDDIVSVYQDRLTQALNDFQNGKTPGDYAKVDATVRQQTGALHAMDPAYRKLQDFKSTLQALRSAGVNSSLGQYLYDQDVATFKEAAAPERYQKLVDVIDGQTTQLIAEQTEAMPFIGSALLDAFSARISLLKQYGEDTSAFQQQYDADAKALASAKSVADYLTLAHSVNSQTKAMSLSLVRGKARYDLKQLKSLIADTDKQTIHDDYNGVDYPVAYEYADQGRGVGDVEDTLNQAYDLNSYAQADDAVSVLQINLRALRDDLGDKTAYNQPHQTDLDVMKTYDILKGRVAMVSLREQAARFYENGKLVYSTYVTTGNTSKPSVPGLHYAMDRYYKIKLTSPDPKGSKFYYEPTPVTWAVLYANYGFLLHDAWWRLVFGPGSEFPHPNDGLAFNDGSHGCVNFPPVSMQWVYDWLPLGSPIVVY